MTMTPEEKKLLAAHIIEQIQVLQKEIQKS